MDIHPTDQEYDRYQQAVAKRREFILAMTTVISMATILMFAIWRWS